MLWRFFPPTSVIICVVFVSGCLRRGSEGKYHFTICILLLVDRQRSKMDSQQVSFVLKYQ